MRKPPSTTGQDDHGTTRIAMREHEVSAAQTLWRNLHELPILRTSVRLNRSSLHTTVRHCHTEGSGQATMTALTEPLPVMRKRNSGATRKPPGSNET